MRHEYMTSPHMSKDCEWCGAMGKVRATGFDADEQLVEWKCIDCRARHQDKNFYIPTVEEHIIWLEQWLVAFKFKRQKLSPRANEMAEEFIQPYKDLLHKLKNKGNKFWEPDK